MPDTFFKVWEKKKSDVVGENKNNEGAENFHGERKEEIHEITTSIY